MLRIDATEKRIVRAANFITVNAMPAHESGEQTARRAVHGVDHEAHACRADLIPVDELIERVQVRR
jgi:hypothetical protein